MRNIDFLPPRPMEEAPRDGTEIMLISPTEAYHVHLLRWDGGRWWDRGHDNSWPDAAFTGWWHLPNPEDYT